VPTPLAPLVLGPSLDASSRGMVTNPLLPVFGASVEVFARAFDQPGALHELAARPAGGVAASPGNGSMISTMSRR